MARGWKVGPGHLIRGNLTPPETPIVDILQCGCENQGAAGRVPPDAADIILSRRCDNPPCQAHRPDIWFDVIHHSKEVLPW